MHIKEEAQLMKDIKGKLRETKTEIARLEEQAKELDGKRSCYYELERAVAIWGSEMVHEYLKHIEENMTDERKQEIVKWA